MFTGILLKASRVKDKEDACNCHILSFCLISHDKVDSELGRILKESMHCHIKSVESRCISDKRLAALASPVEGVLVTSKKLPQEVHHCSRGEEPLCDGEGRKVVQVHIKGVGWTWVSTDVNQLCHNVPHLDIWRGVGRGRGHHSH